MPDPILDGFADLAERYPGSRQKIEGGVEKRRAKAKKRQEAEETSTDVEPAWVDNRYFRRELRVEGKVMFLYTQAALAEALHRSSASIRRWEREGKFPNTPFKTKSNGALGGKRLYTREMIEGVAAIAEEEGLLYSQRPLTPRFTQRVTDLFIQSKQAIRKGN